jgi:tetratricopeptide (TPR) repeat protein
MTTQTNIDPVSEFSRERWRWRAEFVLWVAVVIVAFIGVSVFVIESLKLHPIDAWVRFLAVLTIVAVFPISYAAYQRLRSDIIIKRLEVEFKLLGYNEGSRFNQADQVSVSDLYNTVYNPWQYSLFIALIIIVSLFVLIAAGPTVEPTMGLPIQFTQREAPEENGQNAPANTSLIASDESVGSANQVTSTQTTTASIAVTTTNRSAAAGSASAQDSDSASTQSTTITLVLIAYLGAYVYSVQELVRRYNTFDLQPQVYSSIFVRMIVAVVLVFVGSSAIVAFGPAVGEDAPEPTAGYASIWAPGIIAFIIGVFPSRGLRWFSDLAERAMGPSGQSSAEMPIQNIEGMSTWHASRLQQMGIDDAQNLAHSDFRRLLLTTPFDPKIIINWVDQAILYAKVGDNLTNFRKAKIRTFYELQSELQRLTAQPRPASGATAQGAGQPPATGEPPSTNALLLLAKAVGVEDEAALLRLSDESNYPNSQHIAFYYDHVGLLVVRQATEALRDELVGLIKAIKTGLVESLSIGDKLRDAIMKSKDPDLLIALGEAYYERSIRSDEPATSEANLQQALVVLQLAVELDRNSAAGHFSLGLCHVAQRDYQQAIDDCNRAIDIDPGFAQAFTNRGLAYLHLARYDKAERDFNEALRLGDRLAEAYYNRGLLRNASNRHEDALEDFERAYLTGYDEARVRLGIASAFMGLARYSEAEGEFSRVISIAPGMVNAYLGRSSAYFNLGSDYYEQAAQDLASALTRDDKNLQVRYNIARLHLARGDENGARQMYQSIIDCDAALQSPEAREAAVWLAAHP